MTTSGGHQIASPPARESGPITCQFRRTYDVSSTLSSILTLVGIFAMRWNVVTQEGLLPAVLLMILPFALLWILVRLLPPWPAPEREEVTLV